MKLQLGDRLPETDINRIEGIIELLADEPFNGKADLPMLAEETELTDKQLIEVSHALSVLGFAKVANGDILITPLGKNYADALNAQRHIIFGEQLLEHVPLVAYIRQCLEQDASGDLPKDLFIKLLRFTLNASEAEQALSVAIEWGRYGDLFEYNFNTGVINIPKDEKIISE